MDAGVIVNITLAFPPSIEAILDRLRLRSLEISGYTSFVPGPETTPNLMQFLVHLRINNTVTVEDAEKVLFNCHRLESLDLPWICLEDEDGDILEEYPPLIQSHHQMSPSLRLATFAFYDIENAEVVLISLCLKFIIKS